MAEGAREGEEKKMTTTTKVKVTIGDFADEISVDLLRGLGYSMVTVREDDGVERLEARFENYGNRQSFSAALAEAWDAGLRGDAAGLRAIAINRRSRENDLLVTGQQKVAELQAKAAADELQAKIIASAMQKRALEGR
jgi:hypothetical protein